jgi:hypothetical protein
MAIAIAGSGPAGFYIADALSKSLPGQRIDLFERLPLPYGLVRYGVAPDHPGTKAVFRIFERVMQRPNVHFFGNVDVGNAVSLDSLEQAYDVVVLATGAGSARELACPGIEQAVNISGMALSCWFNGGGRAPGQPPLPAAFAARSVCIVGNGNVSLDAARLLAASVEALQRAGVPQPVIEWRERLSIEEIHVCGRSSAAETKFSPSELGELSSLPGFRPVVAATDIADEVGSNMEALQLLRRYARLTADHRRPIHFHFNQSIRSYCDHGLVAGNDRAGFRPIAANMVVHAIGQHALPIDGAPFDHAAGHIENQDSLVNGKDHTYVLGWAAHTRGGGIAENRKSAKALASLIVQLLESRDALSSVKVGLGRSLPDNALTWDQVLRMDPWHKDRSSE